jgi:hypothetical protein
MISVEGGFPVRFGHDKKVSVLVSVIQNNCSMGKNESSLFATNYRQAKPVSSNLLVKFQVQVFGYFSANWRFSCDSAF